MRELFLEWITNMTLFSLLSSVCVKLLPGKKYVPYLRLFSGIVLILLFLHPVLVLFTIDKKIPASMDAYLFEMEHFFKDSLLFQVVE